MAGHIVYHLFRSQRHPVRWLLDYFHISVHYVPGALGNDSKAPTTGVIPRDFPNRACNPDQHNGARVRARLGAGNGYFCVGVMVDRCGSFSNLLLLHDFDDVGSSFNYPFKFGAMAQ